MAKKKRRAHKFKGYTSGEPFRNDAMAIAMNKFLGLPEDFEGDISGFEKEIPMAVKIFGSHKVEEAPKDEKCY
jgi:hypothetical protein